MNTALTNIRTYIIQYDSQHLYVAYSGGIDSSALLYLCSQLASEVSVHAIHIHHGLSPNADNWFIHCQNQAYALNIDFISHKLTPPNNKSNIESWARNKRYTFFQEVLSLNPNSLLVTGHHIEDQAETFLLNALRGSGVKGLASIAPQQAFANGHLIRPFLHLTKHVLHKFCIKHGLKWINDESNDNINLRRNAIRHIIMPKLCNITESATITLTRSAKLCAEAHQLIQSFLYPLLDTVRVDKNHINLNHLHTYPILQQKHMVKLWLDELNCHVSFEQLEQVCLGISKACSNWHFELSDHMLHIENKRLFITAKMNDINLNHKSSRDEIFSWLKLQNPSFNMPKEVLLIRNREPHDRCQPIGRNHSQKLKIIFQEKGISAVKRKQALIICLKHDPNNIIAVYPFFVCRSGQT
ncbi:tRNA lysidine(34) synthetase TilS [Fastidiosibacter lacustris]|uniref:tRNA lysidine(34) synthetase TilS n=1 Tax=Fastidiosibacter lacustris TaxID=2056695 RepID=UPI000E34F9F4|nr:tRNA lysidine(34) synthetase TilS [Fastidiosibacter lacustris]